MATGRQTRESITAQHDTASKAFNLLFKVWTKMNIREWFQTLKPKVTSMTLDPNCTTPLPNAAAAITLGNLESDSLGNSVYLARFQTK